MAVGDADAVVFALVGVELVLVTSVVEGFWLEVLVFGAEVLVGFPEELLEGGGVEPFLGRVRC